MNKRILFVDDEPFVLRSLKLLLRNYRNRWDMVFVPDAAAALAELEKGQFDLIMSDMRMPGMDGAELLQHVVERWPRTIRVILSGYADEDAVARGMRVAHKWLSKPCELDVLLSTLKEVDALDSVVAHDLAPAVRAAT